MTRVKVFIDYQNVYHGARDEFGLKQAHPIQGHVRPLRFGLLLKQMGEEVDPSRELIEVRVYRGEPTVRSHETLQSSFQRQVEGWKRRAPMLNVNTRPLRYNPTAWDSWGRPTEWDKGHEKGIDVLLALDVALGAERDEYDVAIICSADTDLVPAIDAAVERGKKVENAIWRAEGGYAPALKATHRVIWKHYLDERHYGMVHDPTDYTLELGDPAGL